MSTRAISRDWDSYGWARNSCGRNSCTFQDSKCLDELDSIVKSHAESSNLLFYTSDTRVNDVNHGQELQSEVRLLKTNKERLTCSPSLVEKGTENQSHLESRNSRVSPDGFFFFFNSLVHSWEAAFSDILHSLQGNHPSYSSYWRIGMVCKKVPLQVRLITDRHIFCL